jgi:transposase-like protein
MEESQVIALRRRVDQERETSGPGRARFSKELKQEVVALLNSHGWGHRRVSKAMGLSESSIHRWAEKFSPHGKNPHRTGGPKFKKAMIVEDGTTMIVEDGTKRVAAEASASGLCLELGCGARVTGLTLAQVAELMRRQP